MSDDEQPAGPRAAGVSQLAIDWAWAQPIANNPGARIVLMCLARRVDETWECVASQEEVAVDAMLSSRTVRRQLDQLEADGYVARLRRFDEKGHRLSDRCRLNPGMALPDILSGGSDQQESLPANLSGRDSAQRTDCPVVNMSSGSDQAEPDTALPDNMTSGQYDLWADWPVGVESEPEKASSGPQDNLSGRESETSKSSSSEKKNNRENLSSSEIREDVEQLCRRLLSWLIKKDYRQRPDSVPDAWRTEARLLLDKDGVDLQEALAVLDWSQRDHFWQKNINGMPKFRTQYGQLELKSRGARGDAPLAATGTTHQRPTPLPPRVGGYENARNFGRKRS